MDDVADLVFATSSHAYGDQPEMSALGRKQSWVAFAILSDIKRQRSSPSVFPHSEKSRGDERSASFGDNQRHTRSNAAPFAGDGVSTSVQHFIKNSDPRYATLREGSMS